MVDQLVVWSPEALEDVDAITTYIAAAGWQLNECQCQRVNLFTRFIV